MTVAPTFDVWLKERGLDRSSMRPHQLAAFSEDYRAHLERGGLVEPLQPPAADERDRLARVDLSPLQERAGAG